MFNSIIEKGSGVSMNYLEDIFNLKEKVVVITGAIGQIGRQICKAYRATGSKVIGVDIKALGVPLEGVDFFTADITKKSEVVSSFGHIIKKYRSIDILINNAGLATPKPFLEITREDLIKETEKNYFSQIYCAQEAAKIMQKKGSGKIINVSSICGITGCTTVLTFSAARGAVNILTKTLAKILAPDIQVNGVAPGYTLTRFWDGMTAKEISELLSETLTKQWVKPEEIADSFLYLVRNDSITGQILVVDGGYTTTI